MVATMMNMNLNLPSFSAQFDTKFQFSTCYSPEIRDLNRSIRFPVVLCFSDEHSTTSTTPTPKKPPSADPAGNSPPPIKQRRRRYRKYYPGEAEGITEEMRFVAMRLRNDKHVNRSNSNANSANSDGEIDGTDIDGGENDVNLSGDEWEPTIQGFIKYLVDSRLVFSTVERIVDESKDVSYAYFRNTGLERTRSITNDIEWFAQQNVLIPEPGNPGITYVRYLEELAEKTPPLFLSHLYNIYFSHIAGGQVIAKKVSARLFKGRELEFYIWERDAEELLRGVREKLNMLGEHWSRDEKTKCLRESTKSFRYLGQIVRLIIL